MLKLNFDMPKVKAGRHSPAVSEDKKELLTDHHPLMYNKKIK